MLARLTLGVWIATTLCLGGCAYVGTVVRQKHYRAQLRRTPSPAVYKHLLDRETFFVFGTTEEQDTTDSMAVLALSRRGPAWDLVDVSHAVRAGSYYALNLPAGAYELVVVRDRDRDDVYRGDEIVGWRDLVIDADLPAEKVLGQIDIPRQRSDGLAEFAALEVSVRHAPVRAESVFYPKGSLRTLDDPLFGPDMASLGLYQPSAFMEMAPLMFYALEDELGHKVPVVFVHGIGGSPRDFSDIIQKLDRRRYRPWFFYYPSGGSLEQVSRLFYEIFLSGRTIPRQGVPMVIVAHSMGGLVAREALNSFHAREDEQNVGALITIGSPLGGHPSARLAARAPVVLPSWIDLDPEGNFVRALHRQPLPPGVDYCLYYTHGDDRLLKLGRPGDGVIPLESQFAEPAKREARDVVGLDAAHVEVLHLPATVEVIAARIERVKTIFPEDHLRVLDLGGYDLALGPEFTPVEAYLVRSIGRYMDAMVAGAISPFHPEMEAFVDACRNGTRSSLPAVRAWQKLERAHPGRHWETPGVFTGAGDAKR